VREGGLPVATGENLHTLYEFKQMIAAAPNRAYLEAHGFGLDRHIADPLRIEDGFAIAPDRPGHGIEFDWKSLERCRA